MFLNATHTSVGGTHTYVGRLVQWRPGLAVLVGYNVVVVVVVVAVWMELSTLNKLSLRSRSALRSSCDVRPNRSGMPMPTSTTAAWLGLVVASTAQELLITPEHFGAAGDGVTNDWLPIKQALAACASHSQGCRVVFNNSYLSGPLVVNSSATTLEIKGHLAMLPKSAYCKLDPSCRAPLISNSPGADGCRMIAPAGSPAGGYRVCLRDVHLTGGGTVSSGGSLLDGWAWWDCARPIPLPNCPRPDLISFSEIEGLTIDNLSLLNSPNHNLRVQGVVGTRIRRLQVSAPYISPNTDGVNFYGGWDQLMEDSVLDNGDDCISVVPVGENLERCVTASTTDILCSGGHVVVRNVTCNGGHGISIGGIRHGNVHNVTFENITATGGQLGSTQDQEAGGGCRIKARPNSTGLVSEIRYKDIELRDVFLPIQLFGSYCPWPCHTPPGNTSTLFANISFDNVFGHGTQRDTVIEFQCSEHAPCENITMRELNLVANGGKEGRVTCENAVHLHFDGSSRPNACS